MDIEHIKIIVTCLNFLLVVGLGFINWNDRKQRATTKSIEELHKKVDEKCQRIAKLEGELKGLPAREELTRIHERIDELNKGNQETNLLLGQLLGQIKQMNEAKK